MLTIKNSFHDTEVNIGVKAGEELTVGQTKRAERVLCGVEGCRCGALHRDPDYEVDYNQTREGNYLATFYERGTL